MAFILGVDPGKKGALAVLDTETNRVTCTDMPGTTRELHDFIAALPIIKACALEKPFAPQMCGTRNVATMFENYGVLKGALQWRDIPFTEIRSNKWKPAMGLSSDKDASRQKAGEIFPLDSAQWVRKKDDGRAEAALIAWWLVSHTRKAA